MLVPCGRCPICLSKNRQKWLVRLTSELKYCISAFFVTLTYDDEHIPIENGLQVVSKDDIQRFMKRLRKRLKGYKIKYYLASEYGTHTMRPHYHMMLYLYPDIKKLPIDAYEIDANYINPSWGLGHVSAFNANSATANYCLKDLLKLNLDKIRGARLKENFKLISKGLGERDAYEKAEKGYDKNYFVVDGKKVGIPRYQKLKMFEVLEYKQVEKIKNETEKAMFKESYKQMRHRERMESHERINAEEAVRAKEYSILSRAKKNSKF